MPGLQCLPLNTKFSNLNESLKAQNLQTPVMLGPEPKTLSPNPTRHKALPAAQNQLATPVFGANCAVP